MDIISTILLSYCINYNMKLKKLINSKIIISFTEEIRLTSIMKHVFIFYLLFSISSFYSCNANNAQSAKPTPSANNNKPIEINRLDIDIFDYIKNPSLDKAANLKNKYGDLLEAFGIVTINNSDVDNPLFFEGLVNYFDNTTLQQIYKDELYTFDNLEVYTNQLNEVNILLGQYFEDKQLPRLSIHTSGFKENIIVLDSMISISGDKYLGDTYPIYKDYFENYQLIQMQPKMITRDYLKAWLLSEMPKTNKRKNLLSEMITEGKVLYILKQLLPEWSDSDLLGYTPQQLQWVNDNDKLIWQKTIQNKYLYSTDSQVINKFVNESPFTTTISPESPGALGKWIGWQIIDNYMKNTDSSLNDLFNNTDSQKILKLSKYNP